MVAHNKNQGGFSLVELLIALIVSTVLILGVSTAYTSITQLVNTSKNLENAQEVLRYSAEVFTRSLKQTQDSVTISGSEIVVAQTAGTIACDGSKPVNDYTEKYTVTDNSLTCELDGNLKELLTGVESISFSLSEQLVSIKVTPQALYGETAGIGPTKEMQIDIALSQIIITNALLESGT